VLGSLGLLHCHRIVYPLTFDDPGWVLDDWCGQCHRKKGLVVWTEPQHQTADFVYGEPLAHAVLGNVDAFELTFFEDSPFDALADYYKLLDAGIVLPLVGASGKGSNATPAGCMRTMAFLDSFEDRSYSTWIESVRKGQTYVSNGPILTFTDLPKPEQRTLAERVNIRYRVQAACLTPFEHFELLWNGAVLVDSRPSLINGVWRAEIEHELTPRESGWVACRCRGTALVSGGPAPQRIFAHSSATIVHMENAAPHCKPDAAQSLLGELDNLLRWAQRSQHVRLQHVVEEARTNFAKRLSSEQV
jgi:hypothetical protein